jgi:hypothetical protein
MIVALGMVGVSGVWRTMKGETTGPSDLELVARLRSRDRAALEVLYDRYAHRVYSLALSIVRDQQAAEDITQELFIHLWQFPHLYEPERGAFAPWLLRSAGIGPSISCAGALATTRSGYSSTR